MSKVDDQIRRAMEDGQFDDLPGKGKPLRLEDDPFVDPEWRMANHVLRSSGFTLPWIEARKEIENGLASARAALQQAWAWRQAALKDKKSAVSVEAEWKRAEEVFRRKIEDLNRQVSSYNLQVPADRFQIRTYQVEREIEAVTGKREDQ